MVPKKIKAALEKLHIRGVVGGYATRKDLDGRTAYTCWNAEGKVVCVFIKSRKGEWKLEQLSEP